MQSVIDSFACSARSIVIGKNADFVKFFRIMFEALPKTCQYMRVGEV